jgi:hypothetical protein
MKSAEEIQSAITAVSGWQRNPASLNLITRSEKFRAQLVGILAALKWVADGSEEAFLTLLTNAIEGKAKTVPQQRKRSSNASTDSGSSRNASRNSSST